jgi:hypothetical protein
MTGLEVLLTIIVPIVSAALGAVLLYFLIKWGTKNGMKEFNKEDALRVQPTKGNVRDIQTLNHTNTLNNAQTTTASTLNSNDTEKTNKQITNSINNNPLEQNLTTTRQQSNQNSLQ